MIAMLRPRVYTAVGRWQRPVGITGREPAPDGILGTTELLSSHLLHFFRRQTRQNLLLINRYQPVTGPSLCCKAFARNGEIKRYSYQLGREPWKTKEFVAEIPDRLGMPN